MTPLRTNVEIRTRSFNMACNISLMLLCRKNIEDRISIQFAVILSLRRDYFNSSFEVQ